MMICSASILLLILLNFSRLLPIGCSLTSLSPSRQSTVHHVGFQQQQPADTAATSAADSSTTMALQQHQEPFIKKMRFQVPESVRLGNTIKLSCLYELSGASLHAMKLFKDDKEFYRYTPAVQQALVGEEQRITFALPGLKVDLVRSNDQDIWIKVLDKRAAGLYKCQVSIEDTFKSISAEKRMDVIEKARTIPSASSTIQSNWLASSSNPASTSSSSSSHPQQRHTVQQQHKNRAQASFMQQQHQPTSSSSSSSSGSSLVIHSQDITLAVLSFLVCTMLIVARRHQQPETDRLWLQQQR